MRLRGALRLALIALALPLAWLVAGLGGALVPGPVAATAAAVGPATRVGVAFGPIHADLLLPVDAALRARFAFAAEAGLPLDHPNADWLVVGWGARDFYTSVADWRDVTARALWRGVTGDDPVLRFDLAPALPPAADVRFLSLAPGQYAALLDLVEANLARGPDARARAIPGAGLTGTDVFFEAGGRFHILRTCNSWLGEALRQSGQPFGLWTPTPLSVRLSLWRFAGPAG